ncbi:hypothetical protein RIF29_09178 [Crotalaria pallida]|uniref:Uncharacterized protein n=1 Tax=Crotalaria pallida TaxID=3830 RepID=A0AAN9FRM7_CROPI
MRPEPSQIRFSVNTSFYGRSIGTLVLRMLLRTHVTLKNKKGEFFCPIIFRLVDFTPVSDCLRHTSRPGAALMTDS